MYETETELAQLQALIDRSFAQAGPHLLSIMRSERRLTARQVSRYLQDTRHVAFATVNAKGEPRVSPLDGVFLHGRFYACTGGSAVRVRHLRRQPAVSLTHFSGDEVAIVIHGTAELIERGDPAAPALEAEFTRIYGASPYAWAPNVLFIGVVPQTMLAYAPHPERFPE